MDNHGQAIDVHCCVGQGRTGEGQSVAAVLRDMEQLGVHKAWLCPTEPFVAVKNREGNALIARAVSSHPDRFVGCAVASPWNGGTAIEILRAAFQQGLRALFLHPRIQGFLLSDQLVDPLIDVAQQFGAPIYADTGTHICSEPFQLAALARRHPLASFIMGHSGYSDYWSDAVPAAETSPNIWLETSLIDPDIISDAVRRLGAGRVVFGSNSPVSGLGVELEKVTSLALPRADLEEILWKNAARLCP